MIQKTIISSLKSFSEIPKCSSIHKYFKSKIRHHNKSQINHFRERKLTTKIYFTFFNRDAITVDYRKDYYQILKIKQTADLIQIKRSFYKLAKQSHPDTSKGGNQQLFKSINQAYNVLSHQQRRRQYDVNRVRKQSQKNFTDQKMQKTANPGQKTYQQRNTMSQQQYKNTEQYAKRKTQAYYHHTKGQWQQFRSGYKYHVGLENQYYQNMTNNLSSQKICQNLKRSQAWRQTKEQKQFLDQMEKYFEYLEKLKQKKIKDREQYQRKMKEMQKQLAEQRKQAFRNTFVGKMFTKVSNLLKKQAPKQQNNAGEQHKKQEK